MSATSSKTNVAKRDLAAALSTAAAARADAVEMRPDCTLRFLAADVAVHLPFPGERWEGEARWVDRAQLARVVKACGDGVQVESIDSALRISSGKVTVELPEQKRPRTYLDVNIDAERHELFTMAAGDLGRLLGAATPFASGDLTRPVLNAVALDLANGKIVSTDSYRLAVFDAPALQVAGQPTVIIALGGVKLLATTLARVGGEVTVCRGDRSVVFLFGDQIWALRERDGTFPDWQKLIPGDDPEDKLAARFAVDAREVVKAASLIGDLQVSGAPLALEIGQAAVVAVSTSGRTRADVAIDASIDFAPRRGLILGVDPRFLRSIAAALAPERMTVEAIGPLRPVLLSAPGRLFLLMPMRLFT